MKSFITNGLFTSILLLIGITTMAQAPCEVSASADQTVIYCTECVTLNAVGLGRGQSVFSEDFNSGSPQGWAFTQQATFNNPCSPNGVDGTTHIWMGNQSPVPRALETVSYDVSSATSGVTICFDMLFATQGVNAPCEGPDEPQEGVALQYSIDGGNTWIEIYYFDPNGGNDPDLVNWKNWCFPFPPGAITSNTKIRWFQDNDSGADFDHWGIDNVNINFNDPTYEITWLHDSYSYGQGSTGGNNPIPVCPIDDREYVVQISNGTNTCYDTVAITVKPSYVEADAGTDTTLCNGACVTIDGQGAVILSEGQTPTFTNAEVTPITGTPAFPPIIPVGLAELSMNINVVGLNMPTITTGSITQVCFDIDMTLLPGFPGTDVSIFDIRLICPSGDSISLVLPGVTNGTAYTQTCFETGGPNIASGSPPYTGSFAPAEPFSDLSGCDADGVWTLKFYGEITTISIPAGSFNSWSITFDDPAVEGAATVSWTPSGDITSGAATDTPTICPTTTTTYTMTVVDQTGCATPSTASDDVTITVNNLCCPPNIINVSTVDASCGNSDGSITITATGGVGTLTYSIDSGATFLPPNTFSNLSSGVYYVVVNDSVGCVSTAQAVTISNSNAPTISTTSTPPSCGLDNGEIVITATGGTGPLEYSIDGGTTFQSTGSFLNLAAGVYDLVVSDSTGCETLGSETLSSPTSTVVSDSITADTCGLSVGVIDLTVTGVAPFTYEWSHDVSVTGPLADGLAEGTYILTITDADQCPTIFSYDVPCVIPSDFYIRIPDAFTPNGDGRNEYFTIFGGGITSFEIQIFNRWGEQVYASTDLAELNNLGAGWDGTFKGKEQDGGTFAYFVRVVDVDDNTVEEQGSLILVR